MRLNTEERMRRNPNVLTSRCPVTLVGVPVHKAKSAFFFFFSHLITNGRRALCLKMLLYTYICKKMLGWKRGKFKELYLIIKTYSFAVSDLKLSMLLNTFTKRLNNMKDTWWRKQCVIYESNYWVFNSVIQNLNHHQHSNHHHLSKQRKRYLFRNKRVHFYDDSAKKSVIVLIIDIYKCTLFFFTII